MTRQCPRGRSSRRSSPVDLRGGLVEEVEVDLALGELDAEDVVAIAGDVGLLVRHDLFGAPRGPLLLRC